jgi:hypothetical protein
MITVEDLLSPDPAFRRYAGKPEMDPLSEDDALQEAQLLDVRVDALRSTVALLFELRTALQLRTANTALFVGYSITRLAWSAESRSTRNTAWNVMASLPRYEGRMFHFSIDMCPSARLELTATSAAFYVGDVPGLLEAPPDYVDDDDAAGRAGIAGWRSPFSPVHAVFLDPMPAQE